MKRRCWNEIKLKRNSFELSPKMFVTFHTIQLLHIHSLVYDTKEEMNHVGCRALYTEFLKLNSMNSSSFVWVQKIKKKNSSSFYSHVSIKSFVQQHPMLDKHNLVNGWKKKSTQRRLISYTLYLLCVYTTVWTCTWNVIISSVEEKRETVETNKCGRHLILLALRKIRR